MTPIINAQLPEFKVQAYHNGQWQNNIVERLVSHFSCKGTTKK